MQQFEALVAAADLGSFAAAARALNQSQSAVSMQIRALERRLGTVLFDRGQKPVRLTEAGQAILPHARAIVEHRRRIFETLEIGQGPGGLFRFGAIPTAQASHLPRLMGALQRDDSGLIVSVTVGMSSDLVARVEREELDAALVTRPERMPRPLDWRPVAEQEVALVVPGNAQGADVAAHFAALPYIQFNRSASIAPVIRVRLQQIGIHAAPRMELQSLGAIREMVARGLGVSVIPLAGDAPEDRAIRSISLPPEPLTRTIGIVWQKSFPRRRALRLIEQGLKDG